MYWSLFVSVWDINRAERDDNRTERDVMTQGVTSWRGDVTSEAERESTMYTTAWQQENSEPMEVDMANVDVLYRPN